MFVKLNKQFKKQEGFTLVEVIVVSVIVAVLAAVAIPLYNSYVRNSKLKTITHGASSLAEFCAAARAGLWNLDKWKAVQDDLITATNPDDKTQTTTWRVPKNMTVTITATTAGSITNGGSVLVTHDDDPVGIKSDAIIF